MKKALGTFSLLIVIYSLFTLATCYSGGENATITIALGVDSAKATVGIEELRHEISFTGPTGTQRQTVNGRGTARATVVAGLWTIEVAAYYGDDLYAVGGTSAEVKAGRNTDVSIQMTVVWTDGAGVINPAISYDKIVGSWAELKDYIGGLQRGDTTTIQIRGNIVANDSIQIYTQRTVTLVAPIYTTVIISRGSSFADETFNVQGTLNLGHGSYPDNSRIILDGAMPSGTASAPLITINDGTLNMNEGVTLQNNENSTVSVGIQGGAVGMDGMGTTSGIFNMKGGTIKNNKAQRGGGVFIFGVNLGDGFFMSGGTISGNKADTYGGGVLVNSGTFGMSGGTISDNKADTYGGGVYTVSAPFEMSGGVISGNKADFSGGGVFSNSNTMYIKGNAKIYNNTIEYHGDGGGIYIENSSLSISGNAEITNNTAKTTLPSSQANGGGVFFLGGSDTFELSGNAKINNNIATAVSGSIASGGGVHISSGTFKMEGGEIKGNTAQGGTDLGPPIESLGGGVYVSGTFTKTSGVIDGYDSGNDPGKNKVVNIDTPLGTDPGHAVFGYFGITPYGKNTDSPNGNVLESAVRPPTPGNGWDF